MICGDEMSLNRAGVVVGAVNTMEQRWSQRRKVALDVDVWHQGAMVLSCRARDVGLGGVYLEGAQTLPNDADLDLVFWLDGSEHKTRHRLKARVVRQAKDGFGLSFRDFDTSSFRALQEILRHAPVRAGR